MFWDLDDTLWKGTLAEGDNPELYDNRFEIIEQLNKRGIVNSIVSKNDPVKAESFLKKVKRWDLFVFPRISFDPKGDIVKQTLADMNLRADNALFIDDNEANLNEVKFYNPNISLISAALCDDILSFPELKGKDDHELTRYNQYRQLQNKVTAKKKCSSNELFLKESNIQIKFVSFKDELLDRLFELTERTNQLNFTKNRMSREELKDLSSNDNVELKLIYVTDNFCDYGYVGFYAIENGRLIHFVFSCRIMNMGIEQFVYAYLKYPELTTVGETATMISSDLPVPDYIKVLTEYSDGDEEININKILEKESQIDIFAIGACDLFHPIAYFSMPNQSFVYECNVFHGPERGVNVGTEYIRSHFDMTGEQKEYCRKHFFNYTGSLAFNSQIYAKQYDYVIMSFHDDMIYKVYQSRNDPGLRVVMSPERVFGDTSVINIDDGVSVYPINNDLQKKWMEDNFYDGEFISQERFYDNVKWIISRFPEKTKVILITGPDKINFFRSELPEAPEAREQIARINQEIFRIGNEMSDKVAVVDINNYVRSKNDISDYIFHLNADTAYSLFLDIAITILNRFKSHKKPMLSNVIKGRKVMIFGNNMEAQNALVNLLLGGQDPEKYIHVSKVGTYVGDNCVEDWIQILGHKNEYYVIIADTPNCEKIVELLITAEYEPYKDFVSLKPISYKKVWNDNL